MSRWRLTLLLTIGAVASAMMLRYTAGEAQQRQGALQQEIAEVEQQVDSIEADALATMPFLVPGSPQRLPLLGKILFFDKALSVNRNEACAFCHMPQTGFQGAIESLNQGAVDMDSNASFAGEVERNVSRDNDFSLLCKLHQPRLVRMHPLAAIAHVILESRGAARRSESEEPGRGRSPPGSHSAPTRIATTLNPAGNMPGSGYWSSNYSFSRTGSGAWS